MATRRVSRALALALASGIALSSSAGIASALEENPIANTMNSAANELAAGINNSSTYNWKNSNVTRTVEVNGQASATAKPGDVLTFTLTYTDNNLWGSRSYIQSLTDVKPAGLQYVANSATYKEGDEDWADPTTADKWFMLTEDGAVKFDGKNLFNSFGGPATKTVSFKWQYRVTDAAVDGTYDSGALIHFRPDNKVYELDKMGPKLVIARPKPNLPGLPDLGAPGQPSPGLNSPGLNSPGLNSPSLQSPGMDSEAMKTLFGRK